MIPSRARRIRILAFEVFVVVASMTALPSRAQQTPGLIAGFRARTDVDDFLAKDLIQKEFDDLISDESCEALDDGQAFWESQNSNRGAYLRSIPTYNGTVSDEWNEYILYTETTNFHIEWVDAAFDRGQTQFARGNADFRKAFGPRGSEGKHIIPGDGQCIGYEESVKKATAYTFTFIESVQLMQKAIDEVVKNRCIFSRNLSCKDAIKAWDASVAIFVGSLEGADGRNDPLGDYGKFLYGLADKRCDDFRVCGKQRNSANKQQAAHINQHILSLYAGGAMATVHGHVEEMIRFKRLISAKMLVPLLQGVYRYAYRLSDEAGPDNFSKSDRYIGEAASFALGALPKLWACSSKAARRASNELKIGGEVAGKKALNFQVVRLSFECNYRCLGITCNEVGSLFDGGFQPKVQQCDDVENGSDATSVARCSQPAPQRQQLCKKYTGMPGIEGRDGFSYFVDNLIPPSNSAVF